MLYRTNRCTSSYKSACTRCCDVKQGDTHVLVRACNKNKQIGTLRVDCIRGGHSKKSNSSIHSTASGSHRKNDTCERCQACNWSASRLAEHSSLNSSRLDTCRKAQTLMPSYIHSVELEQLQLGSTKKLTPEIRTRSWTWRSLYCFEIPPQRSKAAQILDHDAC